LLAPGGDGCLRRSAAWVGEVCEPWMVEEVMKKIAEIKGLDLDETRLQILENVKTLFGI
jgi:Tat protein secretion system quality control protein TatD with DNase activity